MDVNNSSLAWLRTAYSMRFQKSLSSRQLAAEYLKLCTEIPSNAASQKYAWLGQFPKFREWLGERIIKKLSAHDYTLKNRTFETTIGVKVDDIEDDLYEVYGPMFDELGIVAAEWPGDLVYELIRNGDTALCYDDLPFFSASHPVGDGTESNWGGGSGELWVLLDTTRAIKPFIFQKRKAPQFQQVSRQDDDHVVLNDELVYGAKARGEAGFGLWQLAYGSKQTLDATNFNAAMAQIMGLRNDEGSDLKIRPNLLITTPSNRAAALALLKAERLTDGSTNTNFGAVELLITNQLAAV